MQCIKQKQPCGPPHDALGRNIPYIRNGRDKDDISHHFMGNGGIRPWLDSSIPGDRTEQTNMLVLTAPESEPLGSSSEKTSVSTKLPGWEEPIEVSPRIGKPPTHMVPGETIRRMEDEFHDLLRQLEKKHVQELKTQKDMYEEEIGIQRDRYEQRLDDLIRIMRTMGQEH